MVAIIPTFVLAGPAAVLAALFPVAFATLALLWRRWRVLWAVANVSSTLLFAHGWFGGSIRALWISLSVVAWSGAACSMWRIRRTTNQAALPVPGRLALPVLVLGSLAGLAVVSLGYHRPALLPLEFGCWAGTVALVGARRRARPAPGVATEATMLAAFAAGCALVAAAAVPGSAPQVLWTFEAVDRGLILSSPLAAGDRLYVSAAHSNGLSMFGAVYCLDRATGKQLWSFSDDGRMKQVLSSPALEAGRLYVGEGLHEDSQCRLFCLDAASGRELWSFVARSHVESSPRLADGCVYFGAGADGVYCLDAAGGKQRWHFPGPHVDAAPAVVGKRLYAGGAYGSPEAFCLDTTTGQPVWRTPCALSVLGPATVADGRAYFGLGNGKLNRSAPEPAGALLCLDADTGASLWRYDVADAVFGAAAIAGDRVFFGARDRHVYCLGCRDGRLLWRKDLGSAVTAAPVPAGVGLFTVTGSGSVFCLDPADGAVRWQFDLAKHSGSSPELTSAPALAALDARLYLGGGFHDSLTSAAVVYCLKYDR